MFLRKTAIVLLIAVIILVGAFAFLARGSGLGLFSDPTAARDSHYYDRLTSMKLSTNLSLNFTNVVVERTTNRVVVRIPGGFSEQPENFFVKEVRRANASNVIELSGGSIGLAGIGVAFAAPKTNFNYSLDVPATLYSADLRSFTRDRETEALGDWRWNGKVNARGMFPQARFIFAHSNVTEVKALSLAVFDARTKKDLMNSYSYGSETNIFWYEGEIDLWHQTPLEIVSTVAIGPTQTFTMAPQENAELHYPGGWLRLVGIGNGASSGFSSASDGRTNVITVELEATSPSGEDRASFAFLSWPSSSDLPLDIELLDGAGRPLQNYGGSAGSRVVVAGVRGKSDLVKEIRVRYYPRVCRLIFRIPELPGLPQQNRELKNLFDAHIPYMRLEQQWNVDNALRSLTQMNHNGNLALNSTNIYFPLIYTNTTTREIFQDIGRHLANSEDRLEADSAKNEMRVVRPPLTVLLENLRKLLSRR